MRLLRGLFCLLSLAAPALGGPRIASEPSTLVYPDYWHTPLGLHRGTPRLLAFMLGDQVKFDDPMGVACARMAEQGGTGPQITAFGVNSGSGQIVYNPDMMHLAVFGQAGGGDGRFYNPIGIACHPSGRVAVADSGNHRIVFLRYKDGKLQWDHVLGTHGSGPGQFENPRWVALDSQERLYVSDTGNNRIQVFNADDSFVTTWGGDPNANNSIVEPQALAVVDPQEPFSADPGWSSLYVVDNYHGRIQRFGLDGRFLGQVVASDLDKPAVYFEGLALDYSNNLWVADRSSDQIHKFDRRLEFLDSWGKHGDEDGQVNSPRGIAIYRHYGQVLTLEKEAAQYLWIGADVKDIKFTRVDDPQLGPRLRLDYKVTERAWVDAWIESLDGDKIATLIKHHLQKPGGQTIFWNGDLDSGFRIANGPYNLVFNAEATYSSATYVVKEVRRRFVVK
jgi:hypothetical protein